MAETRSWLDFALHCGYLRREDIDDLDSRYDKICSSLIGMIVHADQWCGPAGRVREDEPGYGTSE